MESKLNAEIVLRVSSLILNVKEKVNDGLCRSVHTTTFQCNNSGIHTSYIIF